MESPAPPTTELRRCPSCRRDAPDTFFSEGKNACDCCAKGAPPLAEWIEAKLAERSARAVCECGADVAVISMPRHRQTAIHKRVIAQLSNRDPAFAAEVEAKEVSRAEAARVKDERIGVNLASLRAEQESIHIPGSDATTEGAHARGGGTQGTVSHQEGTVSCCRRPSSGRASQTGDICLSRLWQRHHERS